VNSRMKLHTVALAAAGLLIVAVVRAQSPAPSPAPGKVGVINIRGAIGSTAEGKQAQAELQSQFAPRQTEIENMNKQINDLRQRLAACEGKCSQDEIQRLTAALGEVIDRIGRKMVDVLDRYARENGYTVVLDSSTPNTPILFSSPQIDVTQDIVRLYDQAYPVKGGAPAQQKPPAAKPAPNTTPTKP